MTIARSIENYDFRVSRFEIRPNLAYLFGVSFLTTLDIYIRLVLKAVTKGYRNQEIYFLCVKLLRLYSIGFCNWVLLNFHCWWSEKLCNQQHMFKLLELVIYLRFVQKGWSQIRGLCIKRKKATTKSSLIGYWSKG